MLANTPVYELAKDLGITNMELVSRIRSLGIDIKNHLSRLNAAEVAKVRKSFLASDSQGSIPQGVMAAATKKTAPPVEIINDIDRLVHLIDDPETTYQAECRISIRLPWQIRPHEYLRFAELDIKGADKRSLVNALGNAKRALECQLDSLMIAFRMSNVAAKWNVPRRLEFLNKINVVAPTILGKINKHRNEMEHRYICPAHEIVEDFVGVVALFLPATEKHIHDFVEDLDLYCAKHAGFRVTFVDDNLCVKFSHSFNDRPEVSYKAGTEEYLKLLAAIMRILDPNS